MNFTLGDVFVLLAVVLLVLILLVGRASILHYEQSQKAGEARDLLEETIEALPAGIAVYDRDERLMMFNAAAAEADQAETEGFHGAG